MGARQVMPRLQCNLKDAISGKALGDRTKQLGVARGLLTAVAALHENGMVHRDSEHALEDI